MGSVYDVVNASEAECPELFRIRNSVEAYVDDSLKEYLTRCEDFCKLNKLSYKKTKSFFDSIWGAIELNQGEILLIDSPIIQRLRKIKQLGLVELLYDGGNHTRFSHMLGVIHTSTLMVNQILSEAQKNDHDSFDSNVIQIIRLAAIFHDCGHLFCSHGAERFFQDEPSRYTKIHEINAINVFFRNRLGTEPSISEIISVLILNSPGTRKLISKIDLSLHGIDFDNQNQEATIEKIACLIFGYPYDIKWTIFAQVIKGQIDADRIDYLRRDAYTTGLPSGVDYSRIFQKIKITQNVKPLEMVANAGEQTNGHLELAIAPSAVNTIDQLIISRLMMFENIYFHPKTLSSEIYLREGLGLLDSSTSGLVDNYQTLLQIDDNDIINRDPNFEKFHNFTINNQTDFLKACQIFKNIYHRNLLKRCVDISSSNISFIKAEGEFYYKEIFVDKYTDKQEEFLGKISSKLKSILHEMEINEEPEIYLMQFPEISAFHLNSDIPIAVADKNINRNNYFETDSWIMSRQSKNKVSYVLGNEKFRFYIYLATELTLFEDYGIVIRIGDLYGKEETQKINEIRKKLIAKSLYQNALPLITIDSIERKKSIFGEIIKNWGTYEMFVTKPPSRVKLKEEHLENFIHQFYRFSNELNDFDIFVNGMCKLLQAFHIVSKNDIIQSLKQNLGKIIDANKCSSNDLLICSLGNFQDSSGNYAYHINEVKDHFKADWKVIEPDKLEIKDCDKIIVFIDDAFYSGIQLFSIFQELFDIPKEKRKVPETHVKPLDPSIREKLCDSKIYIALIYANKKNEQDIIKEIKTLGIKNLQIIGNEYFPDPCFSQGKIFENDHQKQVVMNYLKKAGEKLIYHKSHNDDGTYRDKWNEEREKHSCLGYEDAQQLIIFPWNTPTYTLTPFWLGCEKPDFIWYPIFTRIPKRY
jgi:hypothetical protein